MFKFQVLPASQVLAHQKKPREAKEDSSSLEDKFREKKREIYLREKRKLRELHFVTVIHNQKLVVLNGWGKIQVELENPYSIQTQKEARDVYVEAIRKSEKQEGGCYFN